MQAPGHHSVESYVIHSTQAFTADEAVTLSQGRPATLGSISFPASAALFKNPQAHTSNATVKKASPEKKCFTLENEVLNRQKLSIFSHFSDELMHPIYFKFVGGI